MALSFIVGFVTVPNEEEGAQIARSLVEEKLAGCVNILPGVRSVYSWKGEVCDEGEALLIFKTRKTLFEKLRRRVLALHPYDVPEVIAFDLARGEPRYLEWLGSVTGPGTRSGGKGRTGKREPSEKP